MTNPAKPAACSDVAHCSCEFPRIDCPNCLQDCLACDRAREPRPATVVAREVPIPDDAAARAIADKWSKPWTSSQSVWEARIDNAVREALAIGRRLEREVCEAIARNTKRHSVADAEVCDEIADAITRRGGAR